MDNRPLTIMILISGNGTGGSDRLALDIAKGLKRRGHRVIWSSPGYCLFREEAAHAGLELYNAYPSGKIDMTGLVPFMEFCKSERIDIVNAHQSHDRHMLLMARLRGLKAKIVFTRHCILSGMPYVGTFYYNFIDMNIAVSKVVEKSLLHGGVWKSKAVTVHGGIDIEKFEKVPQERVEPVRQRYERRGAFHIGIVGRIALHKDYRTDKPTHKRHEILFKALGYIGGNISLLLLSGYGKKELEGLTRIARDNGFDPDKIIFCGFQEDISPFYKIMDLHVLPSLNEGLGLAVIEAMAAGVPCIGAASGGIKEIITDGADGLLFRPGDSRDLADKIQFLIDHKEIRDAFIHKGKEKARNFFHINKTVLETEEVFYRLLNR